MMTSAIELLDAIAHGNSRCESTGDQNTTAYRTLRSANVASQLLAVALHRDEEADQYFLGPGVRCAERLRLLEGIPLVHTLEHQHNLTRRAQAQRLHIRVHPKLVRDDRTGAMDVANLDVTVAASFEQRYLDSRSAQIRVGPHNLASPSDARALVGMLALAAVDQQVPREHKTDMSLGPVAHRLTNVSSMPPDGLLWWSRVLIMAAHDEWQHRALADIGLDLKQETFAREDNFASVSARSEVPASRHSQLGALCGELMIQCNHVRCDNGRVTLEARMGEYILTRTKMRLAADGMMMPLDGNAGMRRAIEFLLQYAPGGFTGPLRRIGGHECEVIESHAEAQQSPALTCRSTRHAMSPA